MKQVQAVLFDMDGIIYDSESIYQRIFVQVGRAHGLHDIEQFFSDIIGTNDALTEVIYKEKYRYELPFEQYYHEVDLEIEKDRADQPPPFKPGVPEILYRLREKGIPIALVTSTEEDIVTPDLRRSGILELFEIIITGDVVERSKPDPEGFLRAAALLGAEPAATYVCEDSHNGIRAAAAGGFHAIMIPDLMSVTGEMEQLAEQVFPDMTAFGNWLLEDA